MEIGRQSRLAAVRGNGERTGPLEWRAYDCGSRNRYCSRAEGEGQGRPRNPPAGREAVPRTGPHDAPLPVVRPSADGVWHVRHLPHLLGQPGRRRPDPRRPEGEMVTGAQELDMEPVRIRASRLGSDTERLICSFAWRKPMSYRSRAVAFDLDAASLSSLREALPAWEIEVVSGATAP